MLCAVKMRGLKNPGCIKIDTKFYNEVFNDDKILCYHLYTMCWAP